MQPLWDKALSAALTVAALTMAVILVRREFFSEPADAPPKAEYVREWRDVLPASRLTSGNAEAPITIVEFSDFECPVCKIFHGTIRRVQEQYPDKVSYSFAHFPLPSHTYAVRAARASECANDLGKFSEAVDLLFANQDSLSRPDWPWLTKVVAGNEVAGFERCMAEKATPPLVLAGITLGNKMKVRATPTVFVNGWRYPGMPSDSEFVRAIGDLVAGKQPYRGFPKDAISSQRRVASRD